MHDIRFIRENPDAFDRALARRNLNEEEKSLFLPAPDFHR